MKLKIIFLVLLFSSSAFSASDKGAMFGVNYLTVSQKSDNTPDASGNVSGSTDGKMTMMDIKLGYAMSPLYVGAIYSTYTTDTKSGAATISQKRTFIGPTIGYHGNGYFLDFSYLLNGKYADYGGSAEFSDGTGIGLDFGYMTQVSGQLYLGAMLAYRSLTFKKYKVLGGTDISTTWTQTEYYPLLGFAVIF